MAAFIDLFDQPDSSEEEEEANARQHKRYKLRYNPLDDPDMNDIDIYKRYLFTREGIRQIVDIVRDDIAPAGNRFSNRGLPISDELQVLATLHYLDGNTFQLHDGDTLGLSQQSISNCIDRVTSSLHRQRNEFIHFQETDEELHETNVAFA